MADDSVANLKRLHAQTRALLDDSAVVSQDYNQLSRGERFVHFWVLVGKSFVRNRCPVRASALAYTTLLALIPLLAVAVSISTAFIKNQSELPTEKWINQLVEKVAPQLDLVSADGKEETNGRHQLSKNINGFIGNIRSGTLGVTGTLALVFVAISLLSTVEATFNDIWGIEQGRTWFARIVQYWAVITLGPLIFVVVIGLSGSPHLDASKKLLEALPWIGTFFFKLLPFAILSCAFAVFYKLMPNTRVTWGAALAGGVFGGCLWQANNLLSVTYASRVVTYSKIYGSLGILPLFLVGLYFSWLVMLLGAQVAYAHQNRRTYLQEKQADQINQHGKEFVALRLMTEIARRFRQNSPPPSLTALAEAVGAPSRFVSQVAATLGSARLLVEVSGPETGYVPARPIDQISARDILQALRSGQGHELETSPGPERDQLRQAREQIEDAEARVAAGLTLDKLLAATDERANPPA